MASTTTSPRYQRLLEVLDLAFTKSQEKFDVEQAVKECYGEDGDENNDNTVFQNLVRGMLETAKTEVVEEMQSFLKTNAVEDKLQKLEAVIAKLEGDAVSKKQAAEADKESAIRALQKSQLGNNLQPQDLVNYRAYQRMRQEKSAMEHQIAALETEIAQLEDTKKERSNDTTAKLSKIQLVGKELGKSADLCSLVS